MSTKTLSGKWTFNESLTFIGWADLDVAGTASQKINFTLPNFSETVYTSFVVSDAGSAIIVNINYGTTASILELYYSTTGWKAETYRIIDFGAEPQEVSAEFYAWFTENATPEFILTARDLYRKINGKPTKLTLYKKLGGKLIPLDEHTKEVKT